jgi:acyl-coenzyme A synthetase/AMP-(fatty) acid ligase
MPKSITFGPLPRTATGKVQKYVLRDTAKSQFGNVFED